MTRKSSDNAAPKSLRAPGKPARLCFAGLPFDPLTVEQTVQFLDRQSRDGGFATYVTPNLSFIYPARKNAEARRILGAATLSTNDSRLLHRLARLAGLELEFAPGAYVVDRLFREVITSDDGVCLIGGTPQIAADLRATFGLDRLVQHVPPMGFIHDEAAVRAAVEFVARRPSRFVMVAMGPPQSELLCARLAEDGRARGLAMCIGSSLEVLTGHAPRAPDWMEQAGLVWLFRLLREPRRLWRRYLVHGLYGLAICLRDIVALRVGRRAAVA